MTDQERMIDELVDIAITVSGTCNGFDFDGLAKAIPLAKEKVKKEEEFKYRVFELESKIETLVKEFMAAEDIVVIKVDFNENITAKLKYSQKFR